MSKLLCIELPCDLNHSADSQIRAHTAKNQQGKGRALKANRRATKQNESFLFDNLSVGTIDMCKCDLYNQIRRAILPACMLITTRSVLCDEAEMGTILCSRMLNLLGHRALRFG